MSEHTDPSYIEEDEITLKEIVLKIREFYREVLRHWKLITLITIPIVLLMMINCFLKKPDYPAKLTYTVTKDDGASLGVMAGLLGQFGFGNTKSESNLDKMLDLLKSRQITEQVLLHKDTVYSTENYLGNHLIIHLDSLKKWGHIKWYRRPFVPPSNLKGFEFTQDSIEAFSTLENKALKNLYRKLIGGPESKGAYLSADYSETSGVLSIILNMKDQRLAVALINAYFEKLSKYYIDNAIEKQKVTFDLVKLKYDSIYTELRSAEYQLADFKDRNLGTFTKKSKLDELRLENKIRILAAGLAKATENLEVADFTLKNKTPFIQVIDRPIIPIKPTRVSKLRTLLMSGFLGVFIGITFVCFRKIFREAMAS